MPHDIHNDRVELNPYHLEQTHICMHSTKQNIISGGKCVKLIKAKQTESLVNYSGMITHQLRTEICSHWGMKDRITLRSMINT